jgi:hypothetical protein
MPKQQTGGAGEGPRICRAVILGATSEARQEVRRAARQAVGRAARQVVGRGVLLGAPPVAGWGRGQVVKHRVRRGHVQGHGPGHVLDHGRHPLEVLLTMIVRACRVQGVGIRRVGRRRGWGHLRCRGRRGAAFIHQGRGLGRGRGGVQSSRRAA